MPAYGIYTNGNKIKIVATDCNNLSTFDLYKPFICEVKYH